MKRWVKLSVLSIGGALFLVFVVSGLTLAQGPQNGSNGSGLAFFVRGLMTRYMPVDSFGTTADVNTRGDLMVAIALPERAELVRLGNSWAVQDTTSVAVVAGVPTTTAQNSFWNGEPDGGKSYVVDDVFCVSVTAGAAVTGHAIEGMLNKGPVAAPSAVSLTVSTMNGRNYPGKIVVARSATVTNDGWWTLSSNANATSWASAADVWGAIDAPLAGRVIIPPRHLFSVSVLGVGTTATRCGMSWHEVQMPVVY